MKTNASLNQKPEEAIDIFISHSSKDKDLAEALMILLTRSLRISTRRILCTSGSR